MPSESGSDELCSVQAAKSNRSWEGQGRKGAGLPFFDVSILLLEFLYFSRESIETPQGKYKKV